MKVIAYSIQTFEKEFLIRANQKKHDITMISNSLGADTAPFAEGKDAVLVFTNDEVSESIINQLADSGVRFIATRSGAVDHIDKKAAALRGIKLANVPFLSPDVAIENVIQLEQIAAQTIKNLDLWQQEKCVGSACVCAKNCRAVEQKHQDQQEIVIPLP